MAVLDEHYKYNIRLMSFLGLWPDASANVRLIKSTAINIFCFLLIIVQIVPLLTTEADLMKTLQTMSPIIMVLGSVVKLNSFVPQIGTIKNIMDDIRSKWNTPHEDTLKILEKRIILGKQQGAIYAIFIYPSALLLVVFRIWSSAVVLRAPPNTNVTDPFPLEMDYLVDQSKYFTLIIMHQNLTFFFVATIYVATETLFILWLQHGISLYELASYHVINGVAEIPSHMSHKLTDAYRQSCIAKAVTYHVEGKNFLMELKNISALSYAILLVFAIISLAINLFRISTAISVTHDEEEILLATFFSLSELVYMFYLNYVVQQCLNYADDFPTIIYSTPWYERSVTVQKGVLIMLIRCAEPLIIDFYGFYKASIEGFAGLLKTTVSYFMMMTSLQ